MNSSEFLQKSRKLEMKLRQKAGRNLDRSSFFLLLKQLEDTHKIDAETLSDLKKLWEFVRKIYSSPVQEDNISSEAEILLESLISNPKLQ